MKIKTQVMFFALSAMSGAAFAIGQGSLGGAIGGTGNKADGTGKKGGGGNFVPGTKPLSGSKLALGGAGTGPVHPAKPGGIGNVNSTKNTFRLAGGGGQTRSTTDGGKKSGGKNG